MYKPEIGQQFLSTYCVFKISCAYKFTPSFVVWLFLQELCAPGFTFISYLRLKVQTALLYETMLLALLLIVVDNVIEDVIYLYLL